MFRQKITILSVFTLLCFALNAQIATHNLVGYWQNWNASVAPYIPINDVDNRYSILEVSFALPVSTTDMTMTFTPDGVTQAVLISKIQLAKAAGKKVLISVGGATATIDLTTTANKTAFTNSITSLINTYGFDGLDIDIENGNSIYITGGTIAAPTNVAQINLINALKQIMVNYRLANSNKKMLLTMAPETAYVQGGQSAFSSIWGGYLPIIHALRDSIDLLQVQLYNSGTMYGIDGGIYAQSTADFIVAMTEAVIRGFNTSGGFFTGLPARKVAVGLPACSSAGGGFTTLTTVEAAMKYLLGTGPKPSTYTLATTGGYPTLNGMMTWSVNWDAVASCGGAYTYATTYQNAVNSLVVPLDLLYFKGEMTEGKAHLTWQTANEINVKNFEIERSSDGKTFSKINEVVAKNTPSVYKAFDVDFTNTAYYRLKINDLDGTFKLSKIVFIEKNKLSSIKIRQNTEGPIFVETDDVIEQITVTNTLGQVVKTGKTAVFDISDLSTGIYIISVKTNKMMLSQKVFKP